MEEPFSHEAQRQLRRQLVVFFLTTFAFSWGIFAGGFGGLGTPPKFEHPIQQR